MCEGREGAVSVYSEVIGGTNKIKVVGRVLEYKSEMEGGREGGKRDCRGEFAFFGRL